MTALELLCDLSSLGGAAKFRGASYDRIALGRLATAGLVRDVGVLDAIACPICDDFEDAEVEHSDVGAFVHCSRFGWRPVAIDDVTAHLVRLPDLLDRLRAALGAERAGAARSIADGALWPLGKVAVREDRVLAAYFAPRTDTVRMRDRIADAVAGQVKFDFSMVISASESSAQPVRLGEKEWLVSMCSLIRLGAGGEMSLAPKTLSSLCSFFERGGRSEDARGRPSELKIIVPQAVKRLWAELERRPTSPELARYLLGQDPDLEDRLNLRTLRRYLKEEAESRGPSPAKY